MRIPVWFGFTETMLPARLRDEPKCSGLWLVNLLTGFVHLPLCSLVLYLFVGHLMHLALVCCGLYVCPQTPAGVTEDGRPLPAGPEGTLLASEQDLQDRGVSRVRVLAYPSDIFFLFWLASSDGLRFLMERAFVLKQHCRQRTGQIGSTVCARRINETVLFNDRALYAVLPSQGLYADPPPDPPRPPLL